MQDPRNEIPGEGQDAPAIGVSDRHRTMASPRQGPTPAVLHVAHASSPASVAGAIAGTMRERGCCELQAIGAGAVNQTVKAIAIARGFMAPAGIDLVCVPAFIDILVDGEERTAISSMSSLGGRQ
jgi:stage V sporulation protein S